MSSRGLQPADHTAVDGHGSPQQGGNSRLQCQRPRLRRILVEHRSLRSRVDSSFWTGGPASSCCRHIGLKSSVMARMSCLASLCQGWRCNSQPSIGQDPPQASEPSNSGQPASGSAHCPSLRPTDRPRKRRSPASGILGLIKAYNRYDAQRGAPFPSFAKPHIRGAILHFLRDRVGLI